MLLRLIIVDSFLSLSVDCTYCCLKKMDHGSEQHTLQRGPAAADRFRRARPLYTSRPFLPLSSPRLTHRCFSVSLSHHFSPIAGVSPRRNARRVASRRVSSVPAIPVSHLFSWSVILVNLRAAYPILFLVRLPSCSFNLTHLHRD